VFSTKLSLHTWTLDSTPLHETLRIAKETNWNAVELRYVDFTRAFEAGRPAEDVLDAVRASGLPVSAIGARLGWMFAEGDERRELFQALDDTCCWASALGCDLIMTPADMGSGDFSRAGESVREVGDIVARHGIRFAIEPASVAEQIKNLQSGRELIAAAGHPSCGLLVDAYHVERSGDGIDAIRALDPSEIFYVQYSDVPVDAGPPTRETLTNRLAPGRGRVPFTEFFRAVAEKGYSGYVSYEAPNPATWERDPREVAREAREATLRAL
jgi:2-keto-myo-inositol isomerase